MAFGLATKRKDEMQSGSNPVGLQGVKDEQLQSDARESKPDGPRVRE